jgi:hypothetical protein
MSWKSKTWKSVSVTAAKPLGAEEVTEFKALGVPLLLVDESLQVSKPAKAVETKMTFFVRFKAWFKKFFGTEAAWSKVALTTITVAAPLIEMLLSVIDPAIEPAVANIIDKVKTDLTTAATLIEAGEANPTLSGVLSDIQMNLGGVLAALQVKDPATVAKITTITNTVIAEIQAVAAELPSTTAAVKPATAVTA